MAERVRGISGMAVAATFAGGIFLWSGIKGYKISFVAQDLLSGKDPSKDKRMAGSALTVSPGGIFGGLLGGLGVGQTGIHTTAMVTSTGGSVSGSRAQNQALGKRMAAAVGWTGSQWTAFNNLVMGESGWDANAANPTSNARGIAQNINGWGPGYQPGNAAQQIAWMIKYIQQRYGTPENAWNQWQARSPHWY
jgi:hypothetical protein